MLSDGPIGVGTRLRETRIMFGRPATEVMTIAALNAIPDLRHLIVETSFENELADIARLSKHHWPDSLAAESA